MISVSVIVPVYHVEPYIERCVRSLLAQTVPDMELIFVDDASPDNSMQILQRVLDENEDCSHQIQIIHNDQNLGLSSTRRVGFLAARGEYVATCDSDDWVEPEMYERLYQAIRVSQSDIAFCDYVWEYQDHSEPWVFASMSDPQQYLQSAADPHKFAGSIWVHLMRRELAIQATSEIASVNYGEDLYTMIHAYYYAKKVCHIHQTLYHYNHCNPGSLMAQQMRPVGSWENQRKNIDRIVTMLDPGHHPEYRLTCQWLKFKVKEKFVSAFPSLRVYYQEYSECHSDIRNYEYLPVPIRRKVQLIYSCYPAFWLYHKLPMFRKFIDLYRQVFWFKPNIVSTEQVVSLIVSKRYSLSRFGDGELKAMFGGDLNFQPSSKLLQERLREISLSDCPNMLIGVPDIFHNLNRYTLADRKFWREHLVYSRPRWYSFLRQKTQYASTFLTRFYSPRFDHDFAANQLLLLRQMWHDRHVIFIEGEDTKLGVGNDLFSNTRSIRRIICPSRDAFAHYDDILKTTVSVAANDSLFILALGPTATVLAYDLCKMGLQALDLGHIDIEYEWFRMRATSKVPITGKFTNEAYLERHASTEVIGVISDSSYESQIIART